MAKKKQETSDGMLMASYAGCISRYLTLRGLTVHDLSSPLSKREQELEKFRECLDKADAKKRKVS